VTGVLFLARAVKRFLLSATTYRLTLGPPGALSPDGKVARA